MAILPFDVSTSATNVAGARVFQKGRLGSRSVALRCAVVFGVVDAAPLAGAVFEPVVCAKLVRAPMANAPRKTAYDIERLSDRRTVITCAPNGLWENVKDRSTL